MKEKEFMNALREKQKEIEMPVYWYLDKDGSVIIDFRSMKEEYEIKLQKVEEILKLQEQKK